MGHTYLLLCRVSPPVASQEMVLIEELSLLSELELDALLWLTLAEACTQGEEKESAAAARMDFACAAVDAASVLVLSSLACSRPPSWTRVGKKRPATGTLVRECFFVLRRRMRSLTIFCLEDIDGLGAVNRLQIRLRFFAQVETGRLEVDDDSGKLVGTTGFRANTVGGEANEFKGAHVIGDSHHPTILLRAGGGR